MFALLLVVQNVLDDIARFPATLLAKEGHMGRVDVWEEFEDSHFAMGLDGVRDMCHTGHIGRIRLDCPVHAGLWVVGHGLWGVSDDVSDT